MTWFIMTVEEAGLDALSHNRGGNNLFLTLGDQFNNHHAINAINSSIQPQQPPSRRPSSSQ